MNAEGLEISRAYELRKGATYCIQTDLFLSEKQFNILQDCLSRYTEGMDIKFLILDGGMKLVDPLLDIRSRLDEICKQVGMIQKSTVTY